jgi:hypothetical protein
MVPPWLMDLCARLEENDPDLTNLNLNIRRLDTDMLHVLSAAISQNTVLCTLNLTSSLTKAVSIHPLFTVLTHSCSLKVLHLSYNRLSNQNGEIAVLARALTANSCLQELYLDHNEIDVEGAMALADMLRENTALHVLQLSSNQTRDTGAQALARVLAKDNVTLKRLAVNANRVTSKGVESLVIALQSNVTLQYIEVDQHTTSVHSELSLLLQQNRAGRCLLRDESVPLGMWAYVLGRSSRQPNVLYYFLKELPSLCMH